MKILPCKKRHKRGRMKTRNDYKLSSQLKENIQGNESRINDFREKTKNKSKERTILLLPIDLGLVEGRDLGTSYPPRIHRFKTRPSWMRDPSVSSWDEEAPAKERSQGRLEWALLLFSYFSRTDAAHQSPFSQ